ncbi:thiamine pyrophosphate-dependent enzyme [Pseudoalteromonas sp. MMG022]|uniref:transketolase n=1 Tax=Pseudoalteromonas sp. MMG022 TaxID=2909978 RepID=UPI0031BAEC2C|nr:transketolase [Pseudoalteromonas sp. MMG022]
MVELEKISANIRYTLCDVSSKTSTPHLGSCLSCTDILSTLYWQVLNVEPQQPKSKDRDYFLLGKGHAASALYTTLAYRGYFPIEDLYQHGSDGSQFEEHPGIHAPAGVETVSGSLGHALSLASGMALSAKVQGLSNRFYVLMGDGEINEGTVWEAAMFAPAKQLNNLVAIVDFNKLQGTGESCEIMHLEPLDEKWRAFGWHTIRVNGHDHQALIEAFDAAQVQQQPVCIIADTIKGKGISLMENDNNWHYRIPTVDEVMMAKEELGLK